MNSPFTGKELDMSLKPRKRCATLLIVREHELGCAKITVFTYQMSKDPGVQHRTPLAELQGQRHCVLKVL